MRASSGYSWRTDPELTVFVPCLNEAAHVANTIDVVAEAARQTGVAVELIVCDDGSTDRTAAVVEEYAAAHPEVAISMFRNPRRRGVAMNFVEGAYRGRGRCYRMVTGDETEPLDTHVAILNALGSADIILPVFTTIEGRTIARWMISRLYTRIVNIVSGNVIRYYNGGPVVLREDVQRYRRDATGAGFQAELVTRLIAEQRSYREIELTAIDRGGSRVLTLRNVFSAARSFLRIGLRRLHRIVRTP